MAKSPNVKPTSSSSGAGRTWFKNAASAFKYTTVELGSEHMPFVVGTVTKSINAFNDLRNWVKNSTPFRSSPGGNSQEKKFYKVASNLVKSGFNDIKTGKLAFDGLNGEIGKLLEGATGGDEFDDWGDSDNSFDYDAALNNDTYLSGVEITAKANVDAIGQSTDIIASTTAKGLDVLAKRNQLNSVIMTSKLAEQLMTGNKITNAINTNLMSIVEQNNEASAFREQQQRFMENTEQNLNDIKEILNNMADMTSRMVPKERNRNYGSGKIDFLSGGFDIKEYGRHILENSLVGTFAQIALPMAAPYLSLLGFDTSGIESFGMGGGIKINPLAEVLKRTRGFKNLSKMSSSMENYAKMFFANLGSRNDLLGVAATFLGLGTDNPVSFRNRPAMSRYDKGIARWDGKDQRALREVIPGYLSKIEANTSILAQQIANMHGNKYLDEVAGNTRFFDEEDGVFKSYKNIAEDLQSTLNNAATSAASGFTDMVASVINGADTTKTSIAGVLEKFFNREGFMQKDDIYELGTIIKENLAEVRDNDMSKDAKLIREIRNNPNSFKNFMRSLIDELDKGKIDYIESRERAFNDIGTRTNGAYAVMNDRSGLTRSAYDKKGGLYSDFDPRYIASNKEQEEIFNRSRLANMTPEERANWETQQRQQQALDDASDWFGGTWLGKKWRKFKRHNQNHEITREIKNSHLGWATNRAQNWMSSMVHDGVDYNYWNDIEAGSGNVNARNAAANAQNAAESRDNLHPTRVRVRRRRTRGEGVGDTSSYENRDYNSASTPEEIQEARQAEMADNIRDLASSSVEQNRKLFGKDGMLTQLIQNSAIGKLFEKLKTYLFGEKGQDGFYSDGPLSDIANFAVDNKRGIQRIFTGKGYTDSSGNIYEDTDDAVFKHISKGANSLRTNILKRYLGDDYRDSETYQELPNFLKDKEDRTQRRSQSNSSALDSVDFDDDSSQSYDATVDEEAPSTGNSINTTDNEKASSAPIPRQTNSPSTEGKLQDQESDNPVLGDITVDGKKYSITRKEYARLQRFFEEDPNTPASITRNGKIVPISYNDFQKMQQDMGIIKGSIKIQTISLVGDVADADKDKVRKSRMQTLRDKFSDASVDSAYVKIGGKYYEVKRDQYDKMMGEYTEKYGELEPSTVQKQVHDSVTSITDKVKKAAPIAITGALAGLVIHGAASGGLIPAVLGLGGPLGMVLAGTGIALATRSNTFMEKVFGTDDGNGNKVGGIISDQFQKTVKKKMPYIVAGGALGALKGILLPSVATSGLGLFPSMMFGGVLGPAVLGIGTGLLLSSEKLKEHLFGKDNGDGTRSGGPLSKFAGKSGEEMRKRVFKQIGGGAAGAGLGVLLSKSAFAGLPILASPLMMGIMGAGVGIAAAGPKFNEMIFGTKNIDKNGNVIGRNKDGILDKVGNYIKINFVNPIAIWGKHMFGEIGSYLRDNIKDNLQIIFEALKTPLEDAFGKLKDAIAKISGGITKLARKVLKPILGMAGSFAKGILKGGMSSFELMARMGGGLLAAPLNAAGFLTNAAQYLKDPKQIFDLAKYRVKNFGSTIGNTYKEGREGGGGRITSAFGALNKAFSRQTALEANMEWADKTGNGIFKAAAQKSLDRYDTKNRRKDDKTQKKLSGDITKWARSDNYNETISLTAKELNKRKKAIAKRTGLDTSEWTQQDVKNFMYSSQVRSGKYDEFKTVAQQAQADAAKEKEREAKEDETRQEIVTISDTIQGIPQDIHDSTDAIIRAFSGRDISAGPYADSDEITSSDDPSDAVIMGQLEDQEKDEKAKQDAEKAARDDEEKKEGEEARSLGERIKDAAKGSDSNSDDNDNDTNSEPESGEKGIISRAFSWLGSKLGVIGSVIGAIGSVVATIVAIKNPQAIINLIKKIPSAVSTIVSGLGTIVEKASGAVGDVIDQADVGHGLLFNGDDLGDSMGTMLFGLDDKTESRSRTDVDKNGNEYGIQNGHLITSIANLNSRSLRRLFHADFKTSVQSGIKAKLFQMRANITQSVVNKLTGESAKVASNTATEAAKAVAASSDNLARLGVTSSDDIAKLMTGTADNLTFGSSIKAVRVKPVKVGSKAASEVAENVAKSGIGSFDNLMARQALEVSSDVTEAATKKAGTMGAKLVEESAEELATSNFKKIWQTFIDGIKASMEKHSAKGVTKAATTETVNALTDATTKNSSKLKQLIAKNAKKINKAAADSAAEAAAKTTTPIGWAITGICAAWDATTGALDAANLFYVRKEDVDWKMRVISSILKTLIGLSLIASLIDVLNELAAEFLGFDLKSFVATLIYKAMSDDEGDAKLDRAQLQFRTDVEDYNKLHNTNLSTKTYNEMENATTGSKIWNGIKSIFSPKNKETEKITSRNNNNYIDSSIEDQATEGYGILTNNVVSSGNQYSQGDSRWKNVRFGKMTNGKTTTIGTGGCGPTALANVYKNITGRRDVTPTTIANMAIDNGYTTNGGSNAGLFTEGAARLGLSSQRIDPGEIPSRLMAGQSIIMSGTKKGSDSPYTSSGHIISASGIENGKVIVNDPLKSNSTKMSVGSIMSGINKAWAINGSGGFGNAKFSKDALGYGPVYYDAVTGDYTTANVFANSRNIIHLFDPKSDNTAVWYSQMNGEWSQIPYGNSTVGNSGCLLSSLGMAMSALTGGIDFDPGSMALMYPGGYLNADQPTSMANLIYAKYNRKSFADKASDPEQYKKDLLLAKSDMIELLSAGIPIVADGYTMPVGYDMEDSMHIEDNEGFIIKHDFENFIGGNSQAKSTEHHTMLIGMARDGTRHKTVLFNPGRSSKDNGVKVVDLDAAFEHYIDDYANPNSEWGKLLGYRYFTRDHDMTQDEVDEICNNVASTAISNATFRSYLQSTDANRLAIYPEHHPDFNATKNTDRHSYDNKKLTAALSSAEVEKVSSVGTDYLVNDINNIPELNDTAYQAAHEAAMEASGEYDDMNEDGTPKTVFERIAERLSKFSDIGLNLMNSLLSGEKYKSVFTKWDYDANGYATGSSNKYNAKTDEYISFGTDANGNPILVPASTEKNIAIEAAIKQYTDAKLDQYEKSINHPNSASDAKMWQNFIYNRKNNNLNDSATNYYAKEYFKYRAEVEDDFSKLYDEADGNFVDASGNSISKAATVSQNPATSNNVMKDSSYPAWATKHSGYGLEPIALTSSKLSQDQLNDMRRWLMKSNAAHEAGYSDNMSSSKIDEVYLNPINYSDSETRSTFGIGGFFGSNAAEVLERVANSGLLSAADTQTAHNWAKALDDHKLSTSELSELRAFMRKDGVREHIITAEEAYSSQLTSSYIKRALPYYESGKITDPRSILLGAEMYGASMKADFYHDMPASNSSNELSVLKKNMYDHIQGWNAGSEKTKYGWKRRISNDYHMLTTGGHAGMTDFSPIVSDDSGIVNPFPSSLKSLIPNDAEGYGDLKANSFKSYSAYKSTVKNRPLKLSEMGSGSGRKSSARSLSITANRSYTPASIQHSEGYGRGVDMGPMETRTDRMISLLEKVVSNTGRRISEDKSTTTINNYNTTNNNSSVGYGDLNMNSDGKGNTIVVNGGSKSSTDMQYSDKLRKLHEKIARSPRH